MADSTLRRLVNTGSFTILQEKLERLNAEYTVVILFDIKLVATGIKKLFLNSVDQNVTQVCNIIELNTRIQSQLFKLLGLSASEGGPYGGAHIIKSRLLPWMGQGFYHSRSTNLNLTSLAENAAKDRDLSELQDIYERSLRNFEEDLKATTDENEDLKAELTERDAELNDLDRSQRLTESEKMSADNQITSLKSSLRLAEDEIDRLKRKNLLLQDELVLSGRKSAANGYLSDVDYSFNTYRYLPRASSPFHPEDVTQKVRQGYNNVPGQNAG